jgi:tight adherence protein B
MTFVIVAIVVWAVALGAWLGMSKYLRNSDSDRMKERLVGSAKKKKIKDAAEPASVLQTEGPPKNKLAHLLVEKYRLGPKLSALLEQAGLKWTPARLMHLCLMAFAAATGAVWVMLPVPKFIAVLVGLGAACVPFGYVILARKKRLHKWEESFPETLEFISRSMRAGHAFSVSLEMIHREFQEPISGEFRRTFEEHNLGLPLEVALQKLAIRVPSLDVHFFVSAVLLQKRTGGNLAEILDKLAQVMRERFKLRGRIKAVSAHGRMTAMALSAIPIAVAVLMFFTNPDYVTFFFSDDVGKIMLGVGVFLQIAGYLVMKKIVNIEV